MERRQVEGGVRLEILDAGVDSSAIIQLQRVKGGPEGLALRDAVEIDPDDAPAGADQLSREQLAVLSGAADDQGGLHERALQIMRRRTRSGAGGRAAGRRP